METLKFRSTYNMMAMPARTLMAKRIFNSYLKAGADYPIIWSRTISVSTLSLLIELCRNSIENPDCNVFDDFSFLAMKQMDQMYMGTFLCPDSLENGTEFPSFSTSIFNQIMRTDLGK
jgi:hypothetical protein